MRHNNHFTLIILFVWPWRAKIVNEIEIWLTPQLYHMPSKIIPLLNIGASVVWQRQKEEWSLVRAACAHRIHSQPWTVVDLRCVEPGPLRCRAMGLTARDLTLPLKCFGSNTNTGWLQALHVTRANLKLLSQNGKYALKFKIRSYKALPHDQIYHIQQLSIKNDKNTQNAAITTHQAKPRCLRFNMLPAQSVQTS